MKTKTNVAIELTYDEVKAALLMYCAQKCGIIGHTGTHIDCWNNTGAEFTIENPQYAPVDVKSTPPKYAIVVEDEKIRNAVNVIIKSIPGAVGKMNDNDLFNSIYEERPDNKTILRHDAARLLYLIANDYDPAE